MMEYLCLVFFVRSFNEFSNKRFDRNLNIIQKLVFRSSKVKSVPLLFSDHIGLESG